MTEQETHETAPEAQAVEPSRVSDRLHGDNLGRRVGSLEGYSLDVLSEILDA